MSNTHLGFCKEIRANRGKLTSEQSQNDLSDIYVYGSDNFLDYSINQKHLGISNLAWIASNLEHPQQDIFVEKAMSRKYNKNGLMLLVNDLHKGEK